MRKWLHDWKIQRIRNRRSRMERAKAEIIAEVARYGVANRPLSPLSTFWQETIRELCDEHGYESETIALTTPRGGVVVCKIRKK